MKTLKLRRTALLIFLLLPLLAVECYDEPFAPELPEATQTGKGTMAAKVNGVVWIAEGGLIGDNPEADYNFHSEGRLRFVGRDRRSDEVSTINIQIRDMYDTGIFYAWGGDTFPDGTRMIFRGKGKSYSPERSNPGSVEITHFDTINHIVSGLFSFDGVCENGDTVKVREGRFDIKYENL